MSVQPSPAQYEAVIVQAAITMLNRVGISGAQAQKMHNPQADQAAQPEPINAQLLDTVRELRHALSNVLQHVPAEMWPKWLEVRDRADVVLAAAKGGV